MKIKYSTPELIDLSLQNVQGDCISGSANPDNCNAGANAQTSCSNGDRNANAAGCTDGSSNSHPLPGGCSSGTSNV